MTICRCRCGHTHESAGREMIVTESHDSYTVVLTDVGERKINVIKEVRGVTNYGLKEAKELVDRVSQFGPQKVIVLASREEAVRAEYVLLNAGAQVDVIAPKPLEPLDDDTVDASKSQLEKLVEV